MSKKSPFSIELLSPTILYQYPQIFKEIEKLCLSLWKEIGWSYWVDLTWILARFQEQNLPRGTTVLDAGGGNGLLQFLLAYQGYNVISVDFSRRKPWLLHKLIFPIRVVNDESKSLAHTYIDHLDLVGRSKYKLHGLLNVVVKTRFDVIGYFRLLVAKILRRLIPGEIVMVQSDIRNMESIPDDSIDAVVSCSVIEHMEPNNIPEAVREFKRILKSKKVVILTTSASKEKDWFHEASQGWCFTKSTLASFFGRALSENDRFIGYDERLDEYRKADELKKRLASTYFTSGHNGMPWGVWDPKYVPAGLVYINARSVSTN